MTETSPVHVVGIGRMGLPVIRRLADAGHSVIAHDPIAQRRARARLAGASATGATTLGEAGVVITALPDPASLVAHVGALARDGMPHAGAVWIDLTSCDPDSGEAVGAELAARGVAFVAAPVGGGPDAAEAGALRFHVGGEDSAVARAAPYLEALGGRDAVVFRHPEPRAAYLAKLLVNSVWFAQAIALGEALLIGRAQGLATADLAEALTRSPGLRGLLTDALPEIVAGSDGGPFELERILPQLEVITQVARRSSVVAPLTEATTRLHREALRQRGGGPGELRAIQHLALLAAPQSPADPTALRC